MEFLKQIHLNISFIRIREFFALMDYEDYKAGQKDDNFWFRGKTNLIDISMLKLSRRNKKRLKILNLGAGTGTDLGVLNKYGDNYVIDINKNALDMINNFFIEKRVADACDLPFKNDFFDLVVSFDVFEHIKNDKKAVSEVHSVLKKGGFLLFTVPAYPSLFSSHDVALSHYRRYNKNMLKKLLSRFNNLRLNYWNFVLFPLLAFIRLIKKNSTPKVDHFKMPIFLDKFFYLILKFENKCIKNNLYFPFGLSILGVCKK